MGGSWGGRECGTRPRAVHLKYELNQLERNLGLETGVLCLGAIVSSTRPPPLRCTEQDARDQPSGGGLTPVAAQLEPRRRFPNEEQICLSLQRSVCSSARRRSSCR